MMQRLRRYWVLLMLAALSACSSPFGMLSPSSGGECVQYIECPDGMADCREQASELCPKGYSQLHESDVGEDFGDFEKQHFAGAASGVPHMLATCNP